MTDTQGAHRFEFVPLEHIQASPTNPRKYFDEAQLADLAESIKQQGVAQPILLRPISGVEPVLYELVAGERRWRASKLAEAGTVPAIIRDLDDAQALELQVIENLQRADLHQIEEAEGYEHLMKMHGYTADQLAEKVGKSRSYVYARLKLCALNHDARQAFLRGKICGSTALYLARIPAKSLQQKALKDVGPSWDGEPMSARRAQEVIQRNYMLQLKEAPFDGKDEQLVAKVGSCTACPKRTGNQPELFADIGSADVCTDPECFDRKREAWKVVRIATARASGTDVIEGAAAKKIFPHAYSSADGGYKPITEKNWSDPKSRTWKQLAKAANASTVLAVNPHNGDVVEVVKVADIKPHLRELGITTPTSSGGTSHEQVRKAKAETAYRQELFGQIRVAYAGKLPCRVEWNEAIMLLLHRSIENHDLKRLVKLHDWPPEAAEWSGRDTILREKIEALSDEGLADVLRDCLLIGETRAPTSSNAKPTDLLAAAERYGVDAKAVRKAIIAAQKPPKAKAPKKKEFPAAVTTASGRSVMYRDPTTGDCWSGRGKAPRWLEGKDREQYRADQSATLAIPGKSKKTQTKAIKASEALAEEAAA